MHLYYIKNSFKSRTNLKLIVILVEKTDKNIVNVLHNVLNTICLKKYVFD